MTEFDPLYFWTMITAGLFIWLLLFVIPLVAWYKLGLRDRFRNSG